MIGLLQEKSEIEKLKEYKKLSELNFNIEEISSSTTVQRRTRP
jgi:hypothetical protein